MSVDRTRQLLEKGGCIAFVMIVIAVVMGASMFTGTCAGGQQAASQQQGANSPDVFAMVGQTPVTASALQAGMNASLSRMGPQAASMTPAGEFQMIGQEAQMLVDFAIGLEFGRSQGIKLDDKAIRDWTDKRFDVLMEDQRKSWIEEGKLKKDSTLADFEALALKESSFPGMKSIAEMKAEYLKRGDAALQDPTYRLSQYAFVGKEIIKDRIASKFDFSEEATKKNFDDMVFIRLYFGSTEREKTLQTAKDTLAKIRGGANFEQLVDTMSQDSADMGKKKSETFTRIAASAVASDPSYEPLRDLKPGEISEVVETMAGPAIYKFVKREAKLPPDWEKRKTFYTRMNREQVLTQEITRLEDEFKKSLKIEWRSPSLQFAYDFLKMQSDPGFGRSPVENQIAKLKEKYEASKQLAAGEKIMPRAAVFAKFASLEAFYVRLKPEEQKAFVEDRIASMQDALQFTEQPALRLELVKLLEGKKDPEAGTQLLMVSQTNTGMNPIGDFVATGIREYQGKLKTAKLITPEQDKEIGEQLKRFEAEKAQLAQQQAQQQAQQKAPPSKDGVTVEPVDPNDPEFQKIKQKMEQQMKEKQEKAKANPPTQAPPPTPAPLERTGGR